MSHRGSLLCLPDGVWAWDVAAADALTEETVAPILARAADLDFALIGTGAEMRVLPQRLRQRFRDAKLIVDAMPTGAAVRTYNVMRAEGRRVAAALIAVD